MTPLEHAADRKTRRIIYNDDADAATHLADRYPTKEGFLDARFNWCKSSQVDSYFWCIGNGQEVPWNEPYNPALGDVHKLMLDEAHKADMEIFASLRMNDTHDAWTPELLPREKLEHPECLIGRQSEYVPEAENMAHWSWSAWDYSHEWVRTYFLNFIEARCSRYDWDGLELDFLHMPLYFKHGESAQNCAAMTAFVRDVRAALNTIARERGRAFLLAVTVPAAVEYALRIGLDIETWLSEGLVDLLIAGSGYKPFSTTHEELIELGHRADVPVYPSLNVSTTSPHHTLDRKGRVKERIRAAASNLWRRNPDGVYLFNLFVPTALGLTEASEDYGVLNEIGARETLRGLDKLYEAEAPKTHAMYQFVVSPYVLPAALLECPRIPLQIAELPGDMANKNLQLQIRVTDPEAGQRLSVRVNEHAVEITGTRDGPQNTTGNLPGGGTWFEGDVDAALLRCGVNDVEVRPASWFKSTTMIRQAQLCITTP